MRTRMVREGSVGLLILLGLGLTTGLFLWLRGFSFGKQSYKTTIEFVNAGGMQKGAVVRYRGVKVGKITAIQPKTNTVDVEVEITPPTLTIPKDVAITANQSGLVGEITIDMVPQSQLPLGEVIAKPTDKNCDRQLIICDGSRLRGEIGVSLDQLILNVTRLTSVYSSPELFASIKETAKNASVATASVAELSRDLRRLTNSAQQQIGSISVTANSVQRTANQIGTSTSRTANQFVIAADQIRLTAAQADRLVTNINSLLITNRSTLVVTLDNLSQTSRQLREVTSGLAPAINRITRGKLIDNLETLTANAAQASANLRDASSAINNPTNLLLLQKTLDSARVTFENAQKITSDLDDLTGDPKLRENLKRLINGLSGLVSSTQQVQQQVKVAQTLESTMTTIKSPNAIVKQAPPIRDTSTSLANTLTQWQQR